MRSNNIFIIAISCLYFTTTSLHVSSIILRCFSILSYQMKPPQAKNNNLKLLQQPYTSSIHDLWQREGPIAALSLRYWMFISRDSLQICMRFLKNHVIINFLSSAVSENLNQENNMARQSIIFTLKGIVRKLPGRDGPRLRHC